jgi:hypothetical protein
MSAYNPAGLVLLDQSTCDTGQVPTFAHAQCMYEQKYYTTLYTFAASTDPTASSL